MAEGGGDDAGVKAEDEAAEGGDEGDDVDDETHCADH